MADARCECCDLPTASCGRQAEQRQQQRERAERVEVIARGGFAAQYPGRCSACSEGFGVNATIRRDGRGAFLGPCCA